MTAPQNIDEAIEQSLITPASVTDQSQSITERPIKDLLDARERLAGETAGKKPHFGLRFTKLIPPGCQ